VWCCINIDSVLGFPLTYGAASLKGIPKTTSFLNTFLVVIITCFLIHTMMKSRHCRAILSIHGKKRDRAESCGIKTPITRRWDLWPPLSSRGVAGSLYAAIWASEPRRLRLHEIH
jgi:branched-chain amino acid transport system permease protein